MFTAYLPRLGDAAPQLFNQKSLFGENLNPNDTVLDWLGDVTAAVWNQERDSNRLDADLLGHLAKYRSSGKHGLERATIQTQRYSATKRVQVSEELASRAEALVIQTPNSQIAKIRGFLDQMAFLDRSLLLRLESGQKLRVLWQPESLTEVSPHFGKNVLIEGALQYRPNGSPQILVADRIREATERDRTWGDLPSAQTTESRRHRTLLKPGELNPLQKLGGVLDGQVDDDAFARLVEEFSRA